MTSTTCLVPAPEPAAGLIRTDALGRMRHTREQRERILDEYERSGVSGPKFAVLCGVKYQTFATWWQRRKGQRHGPARKPKGREPARVQWLEASVAPAEVATEGLPLELPGGVRARITHPQQAQLVAVLVRALEQPC